MDVGIYLKNESVSDVDLTDPEKGNPGVGGTEYLIATLPHYVHKHHPEAVDWTIFANKTEKLPHAAETVTAESVVEALTKASSRDFDILVWCPMENEAEETFLSEVDFHEVDVVAWAHNTPRVGMLKELAAATQVKRFVCVGREQLDRLRDCEIFYKSTYIYNGFDASRYKPSGDVGAASPTVTYVGSLVPAKGFHVLAEIWPEVLAAVPDAKLHVIGSGKLYDRGQELGRWNVAAEPYERQFRPHLSDENGDRIDSVTFEGLVSTDEKIELMQTSRLGVVNPTGRSENCPGSAIEFQAAGTPVVSASTRGLLDTVIHEGTGLLGANKAQTRDHIVDLLENENRARRLGRNGIPFVEERFSYERVSAEWITMFDDISKGNPSAHHPIDRHYLESWKWLREGMRILKTYVPPFRRMPCVKEIGERYI